MNNENKNLIEKPIYKQIGKVNIFLTGVKQVGKTTILNEILQDPSHSFSGFKMEWIKEAGSKQGLCICPVNSNSRYSNKYFSQTDRQVGVYFDNKTHPIIEGFENFGVKILLESLEPAVNGNIHDAVIIMDELGTLESNAPDFKRAVINCLDSEIPVLGILKATSCEFLDAIRERNDVCVIVVTVESRQFVADKVRKLLF